MDTENINFAEAEQAEYEEKLQAWKEKNNVWFEVVAYKDDEVIARETNKQSAMNFLHTIYQIDMEVGREFDDDTFYEEWKAKGAK